MESSRGRFDILLRYTSGLRKAITALTKKTVTKVIRAEMAIQLMLPALSRMYLYMVEKLRVEKLSARSLSGAEAPGTQLNLRCG